MRIEITEIEVFGQRDECVVVNDIAEHIRQMLRQTGHVTALVNVISDEVK